MYIVVGQGDLLGANPNAWICLEPGAPLPPARPLRLRVQMVLTGKLVLPSI